MPKKKQAAPYTEKFRREAVRRSEEDGVTARQVAEELGIHVGQIYNWRNQFKRLSQKQFNSLGGVEYSKEESDEIRRLKREVTALKEERDFLKKATVHSTGDRNTRYSDNLNRRSCHGAIRAARAN